MAIASPIIAGTIFENTNKPLREWFRVIHLMLTSKKGISALQIIDMGFGSYKTAWYMCHRIRAALVDKDFDKLGGSSKLTKLSSAGRPRTGIGTSAVASRGRGERFR